MPTTAGSNKEYIEERNEITLTSGDDLKKEFSHHSSDLEKNVPSDLSATQQKNDDVDDQEDPASYPGLVECAPFPTLGSVNEITQTLSKTYTNRTARGIPTKGDGSIQDEENEGISPAIGQAYHTEGWRNPGWLTVIAVFLVNFSVFGTVFSWGNYQKLYLNEVYADQTDSFRIAFVGTSANAMLLSTGLFLQPVIRKIKYRGTMAIGTILAPLGLVLASFATQLWHVYLSQGILFGLGSACVFSPSITLPSQWFVKNRALSTGLAVSGSGIGGVCISIMTQSLITSIGYRNALRVNGALIFALLIIGTCLAISRYPPPNPKGGSSLALFDRSLLTWKYFFIVVFSFLVPFGYVAPFFLTPTYATVIGADASMGASLVSIMSAANAVCRISLGFVGDRYGRLNTLFIFTLCSGIFTMVIWQFSDSFGPFVAYCVLFGLTGGGFVSLLPPVIADIVGIENIQKGVSFAYMMTMFGNLLGTPISGQLQSNFGWTAAIQFPGAMTVASALAALCARLLMSRKIFKKI